MWGIQRKLDRISPLNLTPHQNRILHWLPVVPSSLPRLDKPHPPIKPNRRTIPRAHLKLHRPRTLFPAPLHHSRTQSPTDPTTTSLRIDRHTLQLCLDLSPHHESLPHRKPDHPSLPLRHQETPPQSPLAPSLHDGLILHLPPVRSLRHRPFHSNHSRDIPLRRPPDRKLPHCPAPFAASSAAFFTKISRSVLRR